MYINTHSKDGLITSMLEVLNIRNSELDELLETCYEKFQKNHHVFILDNQYDYFFDYVKQHLCKKIDQVLFTHISRRLDNSNISCGLKEVLSQESSLKLFLEKHGITFKCAQNIQLLIDGQVYVYDEDKFVTTKVRIPTIRDIEALPMSIRNCGSSYWTMTSSYAKSEDCSNARVFYVDVNGHLANTYVSNTLGLRPVITLSTETL